MKRMHKFLSDEDIYNIELRANSATAGPWKSFVEGRDHTSGSDFIMTGLEGNRGTDIELSGATVSDQDFIAAAREDIPRLIAEIRAIKKLLHDKQV